jgi:periplasmic copper chaperone A
MKLLPVFGILIFAVLLSTCVSGGATSGSIEVRDAWVRAASAMEMNEYGTMTTPESDGMQGMGSVSAAYMHLRNNGATPDKLLRVESDAAEAVELHTSEMTGEVMTMRPNEFVEVPANGEAELKPGGMHVMLIGLKHDLKAGDKISLVLVFENAGKIGVQAEVRAP